jgi:hypothetical protein
VVTLRTFRDGALRHDVVRRYQQGVQTLPQDDGRYDCPDTLARPFPARKTRPAFLVGRFEKIRLQELRRSVSEIADRRQRIPIRATQRPPRFRMSQKQIK